MDELNEMIPSEAREAMEQCKNSVAQFNSELSRLLAPGMKMLQAWSENVEKNLRIVLSHPGVRHSVSIHRCQTIEHPIFYELFEPDFDEEELRMNWSAIRVKLYSRFPRELDSFSRLDRYNQILKCQTIHSFVAVCRSTYPEIESLLRDELLLADPEWRRKWEAKECAKARQGFQSQQFNELIRNKLKGKEFADHDASIDEVGIFTAIFLVSLEKAFRSFDPREVENQPGEAFRHMHAHGWAKQATFVDGLNALLLYDLALQVVSDVKARDVIGGVQ